MGNSAGWQGAGAIWEDILAAVQHPIILTDGCGCVLFASAAVRDMLDYSPEELTGRSIGILFTEEDLGCLYRNLLYLAAKGREFEGEVMLRRRDARGTMAHLVMRAGSPGGDGAPRIIFSMRDIDRRKKLERAFNQNHYADLVHIANGIAHEIRNPLVCIGGFVNRLHKICSVAHDHEDYFHHIMQGVAKIDNLIRKVEFFSRIPHPTFKDGGIDELVHDAVAGLADRMEARRIRLSVSLDGLVLHMDPDLLSRAFGVLLENAIDAVEEGGEITVSHRVIENECVVSVKDDGAGIDTEDLPFVFNPFFSTKPDGAGIDLAVVKRIMDGHGGGVSVVSEPGMGAEFQLHFPLERRRLVRTRLLETLDEEVMPSRSPEVSVH